MGRLPEGAVLLLGDWGAGGGGGGFAARERGEGGVAEPGGEGGGGPGGGGKGPKGSPSEALRDKPCVRAMRAYSTAEKAEGGAAGSRESIC